MNRFGLMTLKDSRPIVINEMLDEKDVLKNLDKLDSSFKILDFENRDVLNINDFKVKYGG